MNNARSVSVELCGVWGSIDGALRYMEIVTEGDGYNQYCVLVLLNGEECNLSVIYDFNAEEFYIEGVRKPIDESGTAYKNLRYLVEGDGMFIMMYVMQDSQGNAAYSSAAVFESAGGEITTTVD